MEKHRVARHKEISKCNWIAPKGLPIEWQPEEIKFDREIRLFEFLLPFYVLTSVDSSNKIHPRHSNHKRSSWLRLVRLMVAQSLDMSTLSIQDESIRSFVRFFRSIPCMQPHCSILIVLNQSINMRKWNMVFLRAFPICVCLLFSMNCSSLPIKLKTSSLFHMKVTTLTIHVTSDTEIAKLCACWIIDDSSNRNAPVAATKSKSMVKKKDEFRILTEWTFEIDGKMPIFW